MSTKFAFACAFFLGVCSLSSCGGGGNGGGGTGPQPGFSLSVQPSTISVAPGTSTVVQVGVLPVNSFTGEVSVSVSGLPTGVTTSPTTAITISSGQTQSITFNAASSAQTTTTSVTFQGTSGSQTQNASAAFDVAAPANVAFDILPLNPTLYIGSAESETITPELQGTGSSNFTLNFSATGLPSGVTAQFQPNNSGPATNVTLTLSSTAGTISNPDVPVTIVATRSTDSEQFTENFPLAIYPAPGTLQGNRTKTIRTDASPSSGVFDPAHGNYFVSLTSLDRVDVISAATQSISKEISVPGATSLAITPDGSRILAGTMGQNLYWIDTTSLSVVRQDTLPMVTPSGSTPQFLTPQIAIPVANGKVLILAWLDSTFTALVEWDPSTNAARIRTEEEVGFGDPPTLVAFAANGSAVLFDGASSPVIYNAATDNFVPGGAGGYVEPAVNSTGTEFALASGETVYFYNASFGQIGQTALNINQRPTNAVFSADGRYLYVVTPGTQPLLSVIDAATFALVGQAPAYVSFYPDSGGSTIETPMAADSTGLVFGWFDHGVVFDDAKNLQPLLSSPIYAGSPEGVIIATPDEGPVASSTNIEVTTQTFPIIPDVWFGAVRAASASLNDLHDLQATAPPAQVVGTVDLKVVEPTGQLSVIPQGFSYGITAIPYATLAAPPSGGEPADLFGFGFTADSQNPDLSISIGSSAAANVSNKLVQSQILSGYPYPIQHAVVTVPAGTPGLHDISISSSAGKATIANGFRYITGVSDYSSSDTLTGVLFDKSRNQLYLMAGDHLDVFNIATNSFGSPIALPSLSGKKQASGISLTPDSSKLLVSNLTDASVAVINPDSSSGAYAVAVPTANGSTMTPGQLAATSLGTAFINVGSTMPGPGSNFGLYVMNIASKQVAYSGAIGPYFGGGYLAGSADGTVIYATVPNDSGGNMFSWNASTNTWTNQEIQQFTADAAVSADGNLLATIPVDANSGIGLPPYLLDPFTNVRCQVGVLDLAFPGYGSGARPDDTGAILFVPSGTGIDVFDTHHCDLRERILLKEQVNTQAIPSTAIDPTGQHLYFVTANGLTVVTLDAVPLSIGHLTPSAGAAGTQVTIRGTGFVQGTAAALNGTSSTVTLVDSSTIQLSVPPSLAAGAVSIVLTNPDGTSYSLDDAFTVN